MDKRSLAAIALITVIVMAWLFYSSQHTQVPKKDKQQTSAESSTVTNNDGISAKSEETPKDLAADSSGQVNIDSLQTYEAYGSFFAPFTRGYQEIITIETELVTAKLSRKGGSLVYWELHDYNQWNGFPTQLIQSKTAGKKGELYLTFVTKGAKKIDTRNLYFDFGTKGKRDFRISGDDSLTITAKLEVLPGKYIEKKYTFFGNKYHVNTEVTVNGLEDIIPTRGYNYVWSDGLKYQEYRIALI